MPDLYPNMWRKISNLLSPIPTCGIVQLVESSFSVVNHGLQTEKLCENHSSGHTINRSIKSEFQVGKECNETLAMNQY